MKTATFKDNKQAASFAFWLVNNGHFVGRMVRIGGQWSVTWRD